MKKTIILLIFVGLLLTGCEDSADYKQREATNKALAEAHDFCNHPELAGKFYIMIPDNYKDGYSGKGAIKDLSDGYGGVYWYHEDEIESCNVLNMAAKRVEARRNIMYRHSSSGDLK